MSSSTSVVAIVGPASSSPQGAHHRCLLQLSWWPLSDLLTTPPRGPPTMSSSTLVVVAIGPTGSTPKGPTIDVFQLQWWSMLDPSVAPSKGPAIDFLNFDDGRCWTHWLHRPKGLPSTSSLVTVVATAGTAGHTIQGAYHRHLPMSGTHYQYLLATTPRRPLGYTLLLWCAPLVRHLFCNKLFSKPLRC
jgi:hypothetical protein